MHVKYNDVVMTANGYNGEFVGYQYTQAYISRHGRQSQLNQAIRSHSVKLHGLENEESRTHDPIYVIRSTLCKLQDELLPPRIPMYRQLRDFLTPYSSTSVSSEVPLYINMVWLYTQGDSDVISSYDIYASCFSAMLQVKLCEVFLIRTSLSQ